MKSEFETVSYTVFVKFEKYQMLFCLQDECLCLPFSLIPLGLGTELQYCSGTDRNAPILSKIENESSLGAKF